MSKNAPTETLQRTVPQRNEIENAIALARQKGIAPVEHLLQQKGFSEEGLADGFSEWLKIPRVKIASLSIPPEAAKAISEKIALKHQCLPLKLEGTRLVMAMANPADYDAIQDVQFVSGFTVQPVVATRAEILDGIQELYHTDERMQDFLSQVSDNSDFSILSDDSDKVDLDNADPRSAIDQVPVVKMCNLILQEAVKSGASDVHLEPALNCLQVRMRVDGVLREYIDVPKWLHHPLVSRIKILASLDIAERRLPQDGRFKVKLQNKSADLRVSTLPALYGEKVVMRVLGTMSIPTLESMQFSEWQLTTLTDCLSQPQGMILMTGPTGSGKTTTLYSMISKRKSAEVNIVTVEDPVEYQLAGINQVQVNTRAGLTFAGTLRSILRQDPDVILVGEIRDAETAEVAFQAANTGHLVLSTLHTDDSFGAIIRLLDLKVDRSLISGSLSLVVAQRLARRTCQECKEPYTPAADVLKKLHLEDADLVYYRGKGCQNCGNTGYAGRLGIYEMLRVTNAMKDLVRQGASESALRRAAAVGGTTTLLEDAITKVRNGLTNPDEVVRVIEVGTEDTYPCPSCTAMVNREFQTCPYCSYTLRKMCGACGQDLNPEWKLCPDRASNVSAANQGTNSKVGTTHLLPASNEILPEQRSMPSLPAAEVPKVKRPKIVVADDDKGILKVVVAALHQLPMDVEIFTASDGVEALEAVEANKADLVLLDVKMPRLDGFGVCEKLRKDLRTAFLPIMMLTANSDQENRTKGYLVGTDDFVSKPFTVPDLIARVSRLLEELTGYRVEDYYALLGVDIEATQESIKIAYRRLAREHHPDRNIDSTESAKKVFSQHMAQLNEAYGVLSDAKQRREYDEKLKILTSLKAAAVAVARKPEPQAKAKAKVSPRTAPQGEVDTTLAHELSKQLRSNLVTHHKSLSWEERTMEGFDWGLEGSSRLSHYCVAGRGFGVLDYAAAKKFTNYSEVIIARYNRSIRKSHFLFLLPFQRLSAWDAVSGEFNRFFSEENLKKIPVGLVLMDARQGLTMKFGTKGAEKQLEELLKSVSTAS